jgi:hypothetical protein
MNFWKKMENHLWGPVGASTAPKNQFVGADKGITRPYKEFPNLF